MAATLKLKVDNSSKIGFDDFLKTLANAMGVTVDEYKTAYADIVDIQKEQFEEAKRMSSAMTKTENIMLSERFAAYKRAKAQEAQAAKDAADRIAAIEARRALDAENAEMLRLAKLEQFERADITARQREDARAQRQFEREAARDAEKLKNANATMDGVRGKIQMLNNLNITPRGYEMYAYRMSGMVDKLGVKWVAMFAAAAGGAALVFSAMEKYHAAEEAHLTEYERRSVTFGKAMSEMGVTLGISLAQMTNAGTGGFHAWTEQWKSFRKELAEDPTARLRGNIGKVRDALLGLSGGKENLLTETATEYIRNLEEAKKINDELNEKLRIGAVTSQIKTEQEERQIKLKMQLTRAALEEVETEERASKWLEDINRQREQNARTIKDEAELKKANLLLDEQAKAVGERLAALEAKRYELRKEFRKFEESQQRTRDELRNSGEDNAWGRGDVNFGAGEKYRVMADAFRTEKEITRELERQKAIWKDESVHYKEREKAGERAKKLESEIWELKKGELSTAEMMARLEEQTINMRRHAAEEDRRAAAEKKKAAADAYAESVKSRIAQAMGGGGVGGAGGAGGGMGLSPAAMRNQQRAARNQYIKDRVARQQQRAQKKANDDLFARDASTTDAFGTLLSPDDLPIDKQIERTKFLKRQAAQLKANEARERRLAARDFNQGKLGREGAGDRAEAAVKDKLAAERDAKLAAYDRRKGTADDPFLIDGPDPRRDRERKRAEAEYQRKLQFARRRGERNYQGGDRDEDAKSAIQDQAIGGLVKDAAAKNKITQEEAKAIQALLQQSEDNRAMTEQLRTMMEGLRQQAETGAKDARTRRQKLN